MAIFKVHVFDLRNMSGQYFAVAVFMLGFGQIKGFYMSVF